MALLTAAVVVLAMLLVTDDDPAAERGGAGAGSPTDTKAAASEEPAYRLAGAPIRVDDMPSALGVGSLTTTWVLHEGPGHAADDRPEAQRAVRRVDPDRGAAPLHDDQPRGNLGVSFNSDTVSRVNPSTGTVRARIPVGDSPWGMALAPPDGLWVPNHDDDTVQRINTETNAPVGGPIRVGEAPVSVGFGAGSVWTTNSRATTVSRVDPRGRRLIRDDPRGRPPHRHRHRRRVGLGGEL